MQTKEIRIGPAVYELRRVFSGPATAEDLIRKKLEAAAEDGVIDDEKRRIV